MNLRTLKALGLRIDGLQLSSLGVPTFTSTNVSGAWTSAQKQAILAALGQLTPSPTPEGLCNSVDAFRNAHLAAGYADATTAKIFQCDPTSTGRWTALAMQAFIAVQAATLPAPTFTLITADNSEITLAASDCYALFSLRVAPWVQEVIFFARTMKNNILAGKPPADITQGWP